MFASVGSAVTAAAVIVLRTHVAVRAADASVATKAAPASAQEAAKYRIILLPCPN
jgi:hypothetical protein